MIERPVGFVALSVPFVAVLVELLPKFPGGQIAIAASAAVCFAIAAASLELSPSILLTGGLPFLALVGFGALAGSNPTLIGPWGSEILVGALFGVPWILAGYIARTEEPLGLRAVAFAVAVTWGLLLLADVPAGALGVTGASEHFLSHFFALAGQQFSVFGGLLPGSAAPALPLNSVFDAAYAALTAVAVGGLLLVSVRPQTGTGTPLPVAVRAFREGATEERNLSALYGFSPSQLEVFRERSVGESPLLTWPPGLEPIFFGAAAAGAFLVAAYFLPTWAVLGLTTAMAIGIVLLVRFTESPIALAVARPPKAVPPRIASVPPESAGAPERSTTAGTPVPPEPGPAPTTGS